MKLSNVKAEWHPEEGLFTHKDPHYIADYLLKHSDDKGQAMKRLVFYMNRAGDNLQNKTVLNKAKELLKECGCECGCGSGDIVATPANTCGMGEVQPGVTDGIPKKKSLIRLRDYITRYDRKRRRKSLK